MKIVNTKGVPELLYRWLCQDFYDHEGAKGGLSATSLLKPVQVLVLRERYEDKLEVEAEDRIWSVFGSGVHEALKRIKGADLEPVERLHAEVLGIKVSGEFDIISAKRVCDWKVTSAWTVVFDSRKDEWRQQLSIYRWLWFKKTGVELSAIGYIEAIFRDFDAKLLAKYHNYPKKPCVEIPIELMALGETQKFIESKVAFYLSQKALPDSMLFECTDEERWKNKKTGEFNRCKKYCEVAPFCHQLKKEAATR